MSASSATATPARCVDSEDHPEEPAWTHFAQPDGQRLHQAVRRGETPCPYYSRRAPPGLNETDLGLIWLVVDETIAGRAVPAGLDRGAARGVPGRLRRIGVVRPPVGQQPERPG